MQSERIQSRYLYFSRCSPSEMPDMCCVHQSACDIVTNVLHRLLRQHRNVRTCARCTHATQSCVAAIDQNPASLQVGMVWKSTTGSTISKRPWVLTQVSHLCITSCVQKICCLIYFGVSKAELSNCEMAVLLCLIIRVCF